MATAEGVEQGYAYRLKNKRTGLYLTSSGFEGDSYATLWKSESSGQARASQTWNVLSLDNGEYLIAQKVAGNLLTPDNFASHDVRVNLFPPQNGADAAVRNSQTWLLRQAGGGYCTLSNKNGGLFLTPNNFGTSGSDKVNTYWRASGADGDSQLWLLERDTAYNGIINAAAGPTGSAVGGILRMSGHLRPHPETTQEVLIGTTLLPFPLVSDPALGRARQAAESPYYLLKRYGYYKIVYYYEHSGQVSKKESQSTTIGMTTSNAREVETTTSISVTAETSFQYKGFSASLSTTISHQLRTRVAQETTQSSSRTVTVEREYPANGKRLSQAIWFRADRYVLERTDGGKVTEWETTTDQDTIDDVYPVATG
ncbi:hypothetical protein [Streptomyces sp. NBC_00273]|uniref:hypothetical protein n=1 Tax=Streptomyces sp. NBC_00273 TaxID=2903644 RepID=UPI002E2A5765|nr:hypothetical protein [Streptomyces sp. NBC_00273]